MSQGTGAYRVEIFWTTCLPDSFRTCSARGLPASVFMFFACIFMCVSVFVCVFMCACICVCMYLCYKPLLVLYELPVKMWQEIGCEQGIRQGKFFWGGNELDGARNWVGANYWVVTCADRRSSMCRCRENVCACTNTKFSNAIIFTVKCMFIVTKKNQTFQQPYHNGCKFNQKKRNPTCMTRPILGIPVSECVPILVGGYLINDSQICACLTQVS